MHSSAKETIATRIAREGRKSTDKDKKESGKYKEEEDKLKADISGKKIKYKEPDTEDMHKEKRQFEEEKPKEKAEAASENRESVEMINREHPFKSVLQFWKISEDAQLKPKKYEQESSTEIKQPFEHLESDPSIECQYVDVTGEEDISDLPTVQQPDAESTLTTSSIGSKGGFTTIMTPEGPKKVMLGQQGIREDIEVIDEPEYQSDNLVTAIKESLQRRQDVITESDSSIPSPGLIGGDTMTDDECLGAVGGEILLRQQWSAALEESYPTETNPSQPPIGTPNISFKK